MAETVMLVRMPKSFIDGFELSQYARELGKRNLVGAIGECVLRIGMGFEKNTVASSGDRCARQHRSEMAVAPRRIAAAGRALDGMGGVKNDTVPHLSNPVE